MGTGFLQAGPLLEQIPHCGHFGLLLSDCPPGPGSADARKMDFASKKSFSRYALKLWRGRIGLERATVRDIEDTLR